MPILLSCRDVGKSFGTRALFGGLTLGLEDGDRAGLIGLNGSGKTTFLKILAGLEEADEGEITRRRGLRVGYVAQRDEFPAGLTPRALVRRGLDARADHDPSFTLDDAARAARVTAALQRAGIETPEAPVETLSGGWRKRLAIVCQLVREPDLLLLDEPTNHLDIEGVMWLEGVLRGARFAWLVVSHDRYLLERAATRLIEIGPQFPGGIFSSPGRYSEFLEKRIALLETQRQREEALANRARREVEWLKRGPQGRGTKARARIKRADELFDELADVKRRNRADRGAAIEFDASGRQANMLVELTGVSKAFDGPPLFEHLDVDLEPGTKLSLLGRNGSGKSTLLRIIEGTLEPDRGTARRAYGLSIARFEQDRSSLDMGQTLRRALSPDAEHVEFNGRKLHISAWASRFLFKAEQMRMPVGDLSGGEQARVIMARMMTRSADLLILDEPTNDLDIATLEVLEEALSEFPGAVVLVTHDRYLLDRVSTAILSLDGRGGTRWVANFAEWEGLERARRRDEARAARAATARAKPAVVSSAPGKKLSYHEKRELAAMEDTILAAEERVESCRATVESSDVAANPMCLRRACEDLHDAEQEVERLYARWAELDERRPPPR